MTLTAIRTDPHADTYQELVLREEQLSIELAEVRAARRLTEMALLRAEPVPVQVAPPLPDRWLTASEVARRLSCTRQFVYQIGRRGEIEQSRVGTHPRYSEASVTRYTQRKPGKEARP